MFTVAEWSTTATFRQSVLTSAPIWVTLSEIPAELYSLKGISYIACGIGEPLHIERMRLDPLSVGQARVKVEIQLGAELPDYIEVEDEKGGVIVVKASYSWLPPRCSTCKTFGHKNTNCLLRRNPVINEASSSKANTLPPEDQHPTDTTQAQLAPQGTTHLSPTTLAKSPATIEAPDNTSDPLSTSLAPLPHVHIITGGAEQSVIHTHQIEVPTATVQNAPRLMFATEEQMIFEAQRVLRSRAKPPPKILDDFTVVRRGRSGRNAPN
ncbi:PREDICTED: uncharacterized protein LOC104808473 [Tarenaya hassleriana]|uniref:uncharacterized protein LOC104808473 n=1 Tax=Tarenaya hassleriana TaxID=28532 RepID=UPI00053C90A5|nr:PREDICTED: uncharacterized protein LOC104808473 [Tarenaya hassleriana]